MAGNLLMNISQDERERAIFRSRKKFQTDIESNMATAEDNGIKKRNVQLIEKMLRRGDIISEITEFLEITIEEVEKVKEKLKL